MNIHQKIRSLFLVLISGAPLLFAIGWQAGQLILRHRMIEALENKVLQSLVLEPTQIHWEKEGKELLIHGQLFDVKDMDQQPDGTITVKGLFDREETALLDFVKKQMPEQDSKKSIGKLFQIKSTLPDSGHLLSHPGKWFDKKRLAFYKPSCTQVHLNILGPPPKSV